MRRVEFAVAPTPLKEKYGRRKDSGTSRGSLPNIFENVVLERRMGVMGVWEEFVVFDLECGDTGVGPLRSALRRSGFSGMTNWVLLSESFVEVFSGT